MADKKRTYGKKVEGGVSDYIISDSISDTPVKVYPKKIKKNPIENMNEFERVFTEAILKTYEKQRLPVRYTKEGLMDIALAISYPTLAAQKIEREKKARIKSGKKRESHFGEKRNCKNCRRNDSCKKYQFKCTR